MSSSTLATSTAQSASTRSPFLKSSFAPSSLQLHLFASVIQSFESQQLRIHDTNTGRLRQQHSAKSGTVITSLDWGRYGPAYRESQQSSSKKKRKRTDEPAQDVVVAYGTSSSEIWMYSPAEGRVVSQLGDVHENGIRDFKFSSENNLEGWSIGGDSKLVQWDLRNDQAVRSVSLTDSSIDFLAPPSQIEPQLICASTTPFSIRLTSEDFEISTYDSFKHHIHSIYRSGKARTDISECFLAADQDRYINIFDIDQKKLVRTLVAGSEVEGVDFYTPSDVVLQDQLLAVITRDGIVELFSHPFQQLPMLNGDVKSKRKSMTRKSDAQIKLVHADAKLRSSHIVTASIQGPDVVVVSIDGGVDPAFQKIRWQDEGSRGLLFSGTKEIARTKSTSTLNAATMNGVKDMGKSHVDESRTVIVDATTESGALDAAIEISSNGEEDEAEEESEESDVEKPAAVSEAQDDDDSDAEMEDVDNEDQHGDVNGREEEEEQEEAEIQEPTFGDLLASKHLNTISIADAFQPERTDLDQDGTTQLALPAGMSLGTVLTQALRTNDRNLLESCLHANDAGIIQNTIRRLDSSLAGILLSRLAERLASRPGRYGHLLSWVQWTCIAHGGAIAGQPDVAAKIRTLYKVLTQRSKSLDKLLLLKGKLDMLDAQLTFRKQLQAQRGAPRSDQDAPGTIYIEGDRDNWSSDEDHDEAPSSSRALGFKTSRPLANLKNLIDNEAESEDDDDEDMPLVNGALSEGSDDEDDSEDEGINGIKRGGLMDVEAEVSGEDDEEGDDLDGESDDDEEEDEDDDDEDSSMNDFINDGEISEASGTDADEEDTPQKPATKRSKHR